MKEKFLGKAALKRGMLRFTKEVIPKSLTELAGMGDSKVSTHF